MVRQVPNADLIVYRTVPVMPFAEVGSQARHHCKSEKLGLGTHAKHVIPSQATYLTFGMLARVADFRL